MNIIELIQNLDIRITIGLIVFGSLLTWDARKRIKQKQKMKDTPTLPISAASAGYVEIEGIAWPIKDIYTTLNKEQVIYFDYQLQKLVKSGKNSKWVTVWQKFSTTAFLAFDHTGFIRIFPSKVNDTLDSTTTRWSSLSFDAKNKFLKIYDGKRENIPDINGGLLSKLFTPPYRVIEKKIQIGSPILIHGNFSPLDKTYFVNVRETLRLFHERASRIIRSKKLTINMLDTNRDGEVDEKELQTGLVRTLKGCTQISAASKNQPQQEFITELHSSEEKNLQMPGMHVDKKFKVYGDIISSQNSEMTIINSFQDQYLRRHPLWINWLLFILGITCLAMSCLTLYTQNFSY